MRLLGSRLLNVAASPDTDLPAILAQVVHRNLDLLLGVRPVQVGHQLRSSIVPRQIAPTVEFQRREASVSMVLLPLRIHMNPYVVRLLLVGAELPLVQIRNQHSVAAFL